MSGKEPFLSPGGHALSNIEKKAYTNTVLKMTGRRLKLVLGDTNRGPKIVRQTPIWATEAGALDDSSAPE